MADHSAIEWTATVNPDGTVTKGATWNPVRGCTKISPGCAHCYAETFAERFRGVPGHPYEQGFDLRLVPEQLAVPLSWKKPRRVFVNSMSDLFQDGVPDNYIDQVFGIMGGVERHTFQVLTKRAERMCRYMNDWVRRVQEMPPRNVWLGVSVENQHFANERIPLLLQTPAAIRFISAEPLLEAVDLTQLACGDAHWSCLQDFAPMRPSLDWVIVGGESGPGARPFEIAWARTIITACQQYDVPVFVKQLGSRAMDACYDHRDWPSGTRAVGATMTAPRWIQLRKKGGDLTEWPEDLRVREWPEAR